MREYPTPATTEQISDARPLVDTEPRHENESREALQLLAKMNIIILGIPGAGKTTLSEMLREQNSDINYISLGEISRNLPQDSPERIELDRLFALGSPVGVPEFFCKLVEPYIDAAIDNQQGFILDGIPKKAEEVEPLQRLLQKKGISADLIISCEVSSMTAYDRVGDRTARKGDEDTMEIFANRTARYLQDIDVFKEELGTKGATPVLIINTEQSNPEHAATHVIEYAQNILNKEVPIENDKDMKALVFEAVGRKDIKALIELLGPQFDDTLPSFPHVALYENGIDETQKIELIADALAIKEPVLAETPLFLKRLAGNYIKTTIMSIEHLATSLLEEIENRFNDEATSEDVQEIVTQQLDLKKLIEALQSELVGNKNFHEHIEGEIQNNHAELAHITDILKKRGEVLGADLGTLDAAAFMRLQPQLWGQLTSNKIITAPDYNYRRSSNGVPGAHHSLLPFTQNARSLSATSMGEYVPFIEAVSSTEYEYVSTFGFIHLIGKNETGEAYGVEYPIMMHDQRLLALNNQTVDEILSSVDSFYGNHDLWHNMLPVYSDHFILHHAHAPLSYGGRMPAYTSFGQKMRRDKEEYEISVAMAHALTQQERFAEDADLRDQQAALLISALEKVPLLEAELSTTCSDSEIANIKDYLAFMIARKAYNVFPADDNIFEKIDERMDKIDGLSTVTVSASEIATLLWRQGLLDKSLIKREVGNEQSDDAVATLLAENQAFAAKSLHYIDVTQLGRESGSEHIAEVLESWGAIETAKNNSTIELTKIAKARWLAINAPQREQLKGHMEKVHGKNGIVFGDELLADPRDLVIKQYEALKVDARDYSYREYARIQNQMLSNQAYSLLFEEGQETMRVERQLLATMKDLSDPALHLSTKKVIEDLDAMIDNLVSSDYSRHPNIQQNIQDYAAMLEHQQLPGAQQLAVSLRTLANEYHTLYQNEVAYQKAIGKTYAEAEAKLLEEQMAIS